MDSCGTGCVTDCVCVWVVEWAVGSWDHVCVCVCGMYTGHAVCALQLDACCLCFCSSPDCYYFLFYFVPAAFIQSADSSFRLHTHTHSYASILLPVMSLILSAMATARREREEKWRDIPLICEDVINSS